MSIDPLTIETESRIWITTPGGAPATNDQVEHPPYYNWHPTVEAVEVCEAFSFNLGNAMKYIFRSGGPVRKGDISTDLEKAIWYIRRELERIRDARDG